MTSFHRRTLFALPSGIFLAAVIILSHVTTNSPQPVTFFKLKGKDRNPDAFYLCASGGVFSCGFIYDPHASDDWMFKTAEGSMEQLDRKMIGFDK
jgi:hypothetical protein